MRRISRMMMKLIYLRESIFLRLFSSNDADTRSNTTTHTSSRRWWRLSCRYLCCAARNPPSDDSQRHKSLVSHLSGTFLSPSLPPPSFSFALCLCLLLGRRLFALVPPRRSSPFFDFSPRILLSQPKSSATGSRPYISPTRHSFLSFHGHGGVSQEHRSEHNIDPAQPASAYHHDDLAALHRCWRFTVNRRTCAYITAGNLWML